MNTSLKLGDRHCSHGAAALDPAGIQARLREVPDWRAGDGRIARDYVFADYRATIAFVNAVAGMAEEQDHHPDMTVGYRRCTVAYTTHSASGALTENDFICAAKADALYQQRGGA